MNPLLDVYIMVIHRGNFVKANFVKSATRHSILLVRDFVCILDCFYIFLFGPQKAIIDPLRGVFFVLTALNYCVELGPNPHSEANKN